MMQGRRVSIVANPVELPHAQKKHVPTGGGGGGARRKSVAGKGGRRKSVAGKDAGAGSRRKSTVVATTPKELGEQGLASTSGGKVGEQMWARMPPKHAEVYDKCTVIEASSGSKVKVQFVDGSSSSLPAMTTCGS